MPSAPAVRFEALRARGAGDVPPADPRAIDVALLDMNAGWANVGHDAMVAIVRDAAEASDAALALAGARVRVVSYAVRDALAVPEHAPGRALYLGTGGPGHLDPRRNVAARGTAEIVEDPSWEAPLWRLFAGVLADESAALYGVCHTFGLLCRWSGVAEPALRGEAKGGPRSGIGTNVLTPAALEHPWFGGLATAHAPGAPAATLATDSRDHGVADSAPAPRSGDGRSAVVPVLDSRHYDLLPTGTLPPGAVPIAYESGARPELPGDALTMLELARFPSGTPRVFAVNSHPEVKSPERVACILDALLERGEIDRATYEARAALLPILREDRRIERERVADVVFSALVHARIAALAAALPAA